MTNNNFMKLMRDYSTVIFGAGVSRVLSFVISLIFARSLGTDGFGIFTVFFTIMTVVWQLPNVIDSAYVRYVKAEEKTSDYQYLRTAFLIKAAIFTFLVIASYPIGRMLAYYVFSKTDLTACVTLAVISGAFLSLLSSLAGMYQADGEYIKYSVVNLAFYILVMFLMAVLHFFHINLNPGIGIWTNVMAAFFIGVAGSFLLFKRIKYFFPVHVSLLVKMLHFSKWLLATSLLYMISQRLDIIVLTRYMDYSSLGIYSAAVRIAMIASLFTASVPVILMPRGSEALKSIANLRAYLNESILVAIALSILTAVIIIFSTYLVKIFFGEEYINSVLYARILLVEPILTVLSAPLMYLFYANNNTRDFFYMGLTILLGNMCALALLVPRFGPVGAALAVVFSAFCGLVFVSIRAFDMIRRAHSHA
jgi:O-antigen/teichoic acid export membrane protein